jgi:two-component system sensor histidine kinase/response regulator
LKVSLKEPITRELSEESLIYKIDLLQILMDNVPDTIYFKDAKCRFLLINKAECEVLGVKTSGEAFGKTVFDFFTPKHAHAAYKDEQKVISTGQPLISKIERIQRANGRFHWVSSTKVPIKNNSGEVIGLVGISRDITERKQIEDKLTYERDLLHALMDNVPDRIYFKDMESRFISVNKATARRLGVNDPGEIVGKTDFDSYPGEYAKKTFQDEQKIMRLGQPLINKVEELKKDGQTQWASATKVPLKGENGHVMGIVGISRDITERKRMEEKLAHERDLLEALMDNVPDAIYFKDAESRFTRINREHARWMGLNDPAEALGKTDFDFYAKEFAREAFEDERKALKTGQPMIGRIEKIRTRDGKPRWASATKVPIKSENGHVMGIVGISRDITDMRNAEEALKKSETALLETNKLLRQSNTDLENYTYVVSHDLKAPLRAIKAFSTFLIEDYGDKLDENAQEYLQRIAKAVSNMNDLIEDLLLLSRVGRKFMDVETVDLNNLLEEIVIDLEPVIHKHNGKVKYGGLPIMQVQRIWMKQFFMNLIDNGLKYNKSENPTVDVSFKDGGEEYLFKVQDNGIGIDKKYHERIFNLFERLHTQEEYEGTGAGLAICRKIAEHLNGRIWVESKEGKGSTFFFALPKTIKLVKEGVTNNE